MSAHNNLGGIELLIGILTGAVLLAAPLLVVAMRSIAESLIYIAAELRDRR